MPADFKLKQKTLNLKTSNTEIDIQTEAKNTECSPNTKHVFVLKIAPSFHIQSSTFASVMNSSDGSHACHLL